MLQCISTRLKLRPRDRYPATTNHRWRLLPAMIVLLALAACETLESTVQRPLYDIRGLDERERQLWADKLALDLDVLDAYLDAGFDGSEAILWATGTDGPRDARSAARDAARSQDWQPAFSPEEAARWHSIETAGYAEPDHRPEISPSRAKAYRDRGLTPAEAGAWERHVEEHLRRPMKSPDQLLADFEDLGISMSKARDWVEQGFVATGSTKANVEDWADFTPAEARQRLDAGQTARQALAEVAEQEAWEDVDLPQDQREALQAMDYEPDGVAALLEAGLTEEDFHDWSFWSEAPEAIIEWKDADIPPDTARRWAHMPLTQSGMLQAARMTKSECPDGPRRSNPAHENPHAVEGRCYLLTGRVTQLWSPDEGLVVERGQPMLLRAPGENLPGEGREILAVVRGTGATRYEATGGHEQTVATFRMIEVLLEG